MLLILPLRGNKEQYGGRGKGFCDDTVTVSDDTADLSVHFCIFQCEESWHGAAERTMESEAEGQGHELVALWQAAEQVYYKRDGKMRAEVYVSMQLQSAGQPSASQQNG